MYAITTDRLKSVSPEDLGHLLLAIARWAALFYERNGYLPTDEETEERVLIELERIDLDNEEPS